MEAQLRSLAVLVVLVVSVTTACRNDSAPMPVASDDQPVPVATLDPEVPLDLDHLADATSDLKERLGHPLTVTEVNITRAGYTWEVRDPTKPENLDLYAWSDGEFADPEPVFTGGSTDIDSEAFSLEGVDLATVPRKVADAALALEVEDAVIHVLVLRRDGDHLTWAVPVSGSRDSQVLIADAEGNVIRVI